MNFFSASKNTASAFVDEFYWYLKEDIDRVKCSHGFHAIDILLQTGRAPKYRLLQPLYGETGHLRIEIFCMACPEWAFMEQRA